MNFNAKILNHSTGVMTCFINGKNYTVDRTHVAYKELLKLFKSGNASEFLKVFSCTDSFIECKAKDVFSGNVTIKDGVVSVFGHVVNNWLTDQIKESVLNLDDVKPLIAFLENMAKNPSATVFKELPEFLKHGNLPITDDGCFLAYKAVLGNYNDKHTNTICNKVGAVIPVMERCFIDDNTRLHCSSGYHVGTLSYSAPGKGHFYRDGDHCMIVKVNPANVVCVPENEPSKIRVTHYEVIGEYTEDLPSFVDELKTPIVLELKENQIRPGIVVKFKYRDKECRGIVQSFMNRKIEINDKKYHMNFIKDVELVNLN